MSETVRPEKTFFSGVALPVFSWGLPFHSLLVAFLFGGLGMSAPTVRALAAWKELAVIGLILIVIVRAVWSRFELAPSSCTWKVKLA